MAAAVDVPLGVPEISTLRRHSTRVELVLSASNFEELHRDASAAPKVDAANAAYHASYGQSIRLSDENVKRIQSSSGLFLAMGGQHCGHLPELCNMVVQALLREGLTADLIPHTMRLVQNTQDAAQLLVVYLYFGAVPELHKRVSQLGPQTAPAFAQIKSAVDYIGRMQVQLFEHPHGTGLLQWLSTVAAFIWSDSIVCSK